MISGVKKMKTDGLVRNVQLWTVKTKLSIPSKAMHWNLYKQEYLENQLLSFVKAGKDQIKFCSDLVNCNYNREEL